MTQRRLIEETFPLKKVSEDSKHEKNVRHGHISTLHIWPARRPLAACRAAIIAALMPDPGSEAERHALNKKIEAITRWGTENGPELDYFRQEIRKAFGGRAPRVLDMFAGGGAIPLEAMRLGCDVTAIDYNPVAWFILKCTLEFPQRLAGKTWPLPGNAEEQGRGGAGENNITYAPRTTHQLEMFATEEQKPGTLADHVRYWGEWVLARAREELAPYYPTVNDQPTVAYLWARTVPCPDPACGAEVPLLKTLWLNTKTEKTLPDTPQNRIRPDFLRIKRTKNTSSVVINARRALRIVVEETRAEEKVADHPAAVSGRRSAVRFEIWTPGPKDEVPEGTMSGAKSRCPVCGSSITPDYIKQCGHNEKLGTRMTCVVVDAGWGKEYRLPTPEEEETAYYTAEALPEAAAQIPYGLPTESQQKNPRTLIVQLYGLDTWDKLYTDRQLLALIMFVKWTRAVRTEMSALEYSSDWIEAVVSYLCIAIDRLADRGSAICTWTVGWDKIRNTFTRFALPITWDFAESVTIVDSSGGYPGAIEWIARYIEHALLAAESEFTSTDANVSIQRQSAGEFVDILADAIVTDPPYYDAIPYADLADFFYVWLRRTVGDRYPEIFSSPLTPKGDELALRLPHVDIPDEHTPEWYEQGMGRVFYQAWKTLKPEGRLVTVFAHKDPEAWETLVTAMIEAGFTVTASWPIDTEMGNRTRAVSSAALASSIWLVCRKRLPPPSPPDIGGGQGGVGRYGAVRRAMQERVTERLRYFWDIGISGPDFVWAAVGPALESYSSYESVRRLDGSDFTVSDFLKEVRRMVADFALGRILKGHSTEGLDEWTRYYLMHRNTFGLEGAPVGECILYSQGYGLDLNDLRGPRGFIVKAGSSDVRLARWNERGRSDPSTRSGHSLGEPHPSGGLPQIDMLHKSMQLWAAGNLDTLNTYADQNGLRQNELFWAVAQAILEMAEPKSRERTLLEAIVAWGRGGQSTTGAVQQELFNHE